MQSMSESVCFLTPLQGFIAEKRCVLVESTRLRMMKSLPLVKVRRRGH